MKIVKKDGRRFYLVPVPLITIEEHGRGQWSFHNVPPVSRQEARKALTRAAREVGLSKELKAIRAIRQRPGL